MDDGARAAFIIERAEDVDRLLLAEATRWESVTIIALPAWTPFVNAYAPLSGRTTVDALRTGAVDHAARVARAAACALPISLATCHLAYESWRAPAFLAALRRGAFDAALFAAWPPLTHRGIVMRAARTGGTAVLRVETSHRRPPILRERLRVRLAAQKGASDASDRRLRLVRGPRPVRDGRA